MAVFSKRFFLPFLFVVINILSKSFYLTFQDICIDEPFTIYHAQFDLYHLVNYLKHYNNPPGFEILLHAWINCFGISAESVRALPMLFSSFTVFFIYELCAKFFDKRVAILSSILYTLSTMNMWFAHDCRVYSLLVLLTVISFYLFFKLLQEKESFKFSYILLFAFINLLLIYGHYFGFFIWALECLIICIFFLKSKAILKKYFAIAIIGLIGYLPQLIVMWTRTKDSVTHGTWLQAPNGLESIYNILWSFCNEPIPTVICIILFFSTLVLFFLRKKTAPVNPYTKYMMIWFLVPFFGMFFISYKIPMYLDRYLLFVSPAFYILLALGISFIFKTSKAYLSAAVVLVLLFFFSATLNPGKKNKVKDAVNYIKTKQDEKTIVIVCGYNFITNFTYYYDMDCFKIKDPTVEYGSIENTMKTKNVYFVNTLDNKLLDTISKFEKVIYFDAAADFSVADNKVKETFYNKYKFIERSFFYQQFNVYSFKVNKN